MFEPEPGATCFGEVQIEGERDERMTRSSGESSALRHGKFVLVKVGELLFDAIIWAVESTSVSVIIIESANAEVIPNS